MTETKARSVRNTQFLCAWLYCNPGATGHQARKALAARNGKAFTPGLYCWYFNTRFGARIDGMKKCGTDYGRWEWRGNVSPDGYPIRTQGGWFVTSHGMGTIGT